jgi:hypothetical protein
MSLGFSSARRSNKVLTSRVSLDVQQLMKDPKDITGDKNLSKNMTKNLSKNLSKFVKNPFHEGRFKDDSDMKVEDVRFRADLLAK